MESVREVEEISIAEARRELTRLPEKLSEQLLTMSVTRRGKPVLAIISWEDYEAIQETLEILADENAIQELKRGLDDARTGRTIAWDDAKAALNGPRKR